MLRRKSSLSIAHVAVTETMQLQGVKQTQTKREEREAFRYVKKVNVIQIWKSVMWCKDRKSKGGEAGVNVGDEIIAPYSQAWFC